MPALDQPRPPGPLRRVIRWMGWLGLAALLVAVGLIAYLHHAGLPGFIREALVQELHAQGLAFHSDWIGLRWYRGIVARRVTVTQTSTAEGPRVDLPEVALRLHTPSLLRSKLVIESIELHGGRLVLPVAQGPDEAAPREIVFEAAAAQLQLGADGAWRLNRFTADCLGIKVHLHGTLTNALALREWPAPDITLAPPGKAGAVLQPWLERVEGLDFERPPRLRIEFHADAADLAATRVLAQLDALRGRSSGGSFEALQARLQLRPASDTNNVAECEFQLETRGAQGAGLHVDRMRARAHWAQPLDFSLPERVGLKAVLEDIDSTWGGLSRLHLTGNTQRDLAQPHLVQVDLALEGGTLTGGGAEAELRELLLRWTHDLEQGAPREGEWQLRVQSPRFDWGQAESGMLHGRFARNGTPPAVSDHGAPPGWLWLAPWIFAVEGQIDHLAVRHTLLDRIGFSAEWRAPNLSVRWLDVDLFDRRLGATLVCQVLDRAVAGDLAFNFDVRRLGPLLPAGVMAWLEPYGWQPDRPPRVRARLDLTLPPWDQLRQPEAWSDLEETLQVRGTLVATPGAYRQIPMDSVMFDFTFADAVWRLTNFVARTTAGRLGMTYTEDQRTGHYRFEIDARLDPRVFRPAVSPGAQPAFDFFEFDEPPAIKGYVAGSWRAAGHTEFGGTIRAAPFRFRGEPITGFAARLDYAEGVVRGTEVRLQSEGSITAESVEFDLDRQRLTLMGARSTVPPMRVARAIGEEVELTLAPYVFAQPPAALVEGWLNVRDTREAAMRFELAGGPFRYWRFAVPWIQGIVVWHDETVRIEDLRATFYDGQLTGHLDVDLTPSIGADFSFHTRVESVDFHRLMADLLTVTNRLEGRLHGSWTVTRANSEDWNSWNGLGQIELEDGYLWDLSLFGGLSDIMDRVRLEVGRHPIKGLTADFTMTNSLIHTRNLQLQSAAMRLDYRGTFDFDGAVNARVEAKLLHDTAVVGPLVSLLFSPITKILEFRVTGTLGAPKLEPLYFPKPLLFPLNPIGTLRDLLQRPMPQE